MDTVGVVVVTWEREWLHTLEKVENILIRALANSADWTVALAATYTGQDMHAKDMDNVLAWTYLRKMDSGKRGFGGGEAASSIGIWFLCVIWIWGRREKTGLTRPHTHPPGHNYCARRLDPGLAVNLHGKPLSSSAGWKQSDRKEMLASGLRSVSHWPNHHTATLGQATTRGAKTGLHLAHVHTVLQTDHLDELVANVLSGVG